MSQLVRLQRSPACHLASEAPYTLNGYSYRKGSKKEQFFFRGISDLQQLILPSSKHWHFGEGLFFLARTYCDAVTVTRIQHLLSANHPRKWFVLQDPSMPPKKRKTRVVYDITCSSCGENSIDEMAGTLNKRQKQSQHRLGCQSHWTALSGRQLKDEGGNLLLVPKRKKTLNKDKLDKKSSIHLSQNDSWQNGMKIEIFFFFF